MNRQEDMLAPNFRDIGEDEIADNSDPHRQSCSHDANVPSLGASLFHMESHTQFHEDLAVGRAEQRISIPISGSCL